MNFDFLDQAITDNPPELGSPEQLNEELLQLQELASKVGSYKWQYDGDENVHDGIVTQDLLKVPGLKDAVQVDPDTGLQSVDANFLSLATLGYVAALTRLVMKQLQTEKDNEPLASFVERKEK